MEGNWQVIGTCQPQEEKHVVLSSLSHGCGTGEEISRFQELQIEREIMASRIAHYPLPAASLRFQVSERLSTKTHSHSINPYAADKKASFPCRAAQSENVAEEQSPAESSTRSQLDLLEQLTSSSSTGRGFEGAGDNTTRPTIREQLAELTRGRDEDFTLQLGKKMKESLKSLNILTISQRRNIKRQTYLNEVARRNDVAFFATIGASVILPPLVILAVAIQTGYVQLFP